MDNVSQLKPASGSNRIAVRGFVAPLDNAAPPRPAKRQSVYLS
jgi:hypothetical protein